MYYLLIYTIEQIYYLNIATCANFESFSVILE